MSAGQGSFVSPDTGVSFDTETKVIEDACRDCGGTGVRKFSTFADYRRFIIDERMRDAEPDRDDDYYHTPDESGSEPCKRCGATGLFRGDGGLITMSMTWSGVVLINPELP